METPTRDHKYRFKPRRKGPLRPSFRETIDIEYPDAPSPCLMYPNGYVAYPGRVGGPAIVPIPLLGLNTRYEAMIDDPDPTKKRQWKDCSHYKRKCDIGSSLPLTYSWVNESINAIGDWHGDVPTNTIAPMIPGFTDLPVDAYPLLEAQGNGDILSPPPNLTQFLDKAIMAMTPGIKSELSILNSLIELKDFKTVGSTISNLSNFATSFFKRKPKVLSRRTDGIITKLRRTFSPSFGPTAAEATHTTADAYLQAKFNVLPLLDDVCGIQTALTTVRSQVNLLLANEGKILYRTFTDRLNPSYLSYEIPDRTISFNQYPNSYANQNGGPTGAVYGGSKEVMRLTRKVAYVEHVFRAKMKFTYTFDRWQREYAQFYGLMDSIGWNLNPSIVWNAIPWSFVVDWVIGVNRWLDKRKVLNLGPKVNILGFMWSCKRSRSVTSFLKSYQSLPPESKTNHITLPVVTETAYQRKVIMPTLSSWVNTSGLNSNEIKLGAALAITRKRLKKRV